MPEWTISILETPQDMAQLEDLQAIVWRGKEIDIIPSDMLVAVAHNGGVLLGARAGDELIGAVFGFPALDLVPDGPVLRHHSHFLAVHPDWRSKGIGFALKRAQWQMVRRQGINRITWTYDPLLSRNAFLNIARLGAACNTYIREYYGEMEDGLNAGLPSDRFQVDWWINTPRVERRLSKRPRQTLDLRHFKAAGIFPYYDVSQRPSGLVCPPEKISLLEDRLVLAEIPDDFMAMKAIDMSLALAWRLFVREFFEMAFRQGYLVTDFVHDTSGERPRSFYVLVHGESTLDEI
jgi:predicted GNAT superfamily acetyltransferase